MPQCEFDGVTAEVRRVHQKDMKCLKIKFLVFNDTINLPFEPLEQKAAKVNGFIRNNSPSGNEINVKLLNSCKFVKFK